MARIYSHTLPGKYSVEWNGVPYGDTTDQTSYFHLYRSDVQKNSPVPGLPPVWRKPLPYTMIRTSQYGPFAKWMFRSYGWNGVYKGALWTQTQHLTYNGPGYDPPGIPSWHENAAIMKALGKLKDDALSTPLVLKERQETANTVTDNLRRLYNGYRSARKGRFREAFRHLRHQPRKGWDKELSSRVLEFNFGVKPVVSDIYTAVDLLHNREQQFGVNGLIKAVGSVGYNAERDGPPVRRILSALETSGPRFNREYWETVATTVRLYYMPDCPLTYSAKQLGLTNPLEVAWEAVPFSFVVDWVYPLGDWFSTLDAALGLRFVGGCVTDWSECQTHYRGYKSQNPDIGETTEVSGFRKCAKMDRRVYANSPIPSPPTFTGGGLNLNQGLNLVSLFGALRRGP